MKHLHTPLSEHDRCELRAGEMFLLSGTIYTARDAAHKRLNDLLDQGKELPLPLQGQIIYYVGPTPTPARATFTAAPDRQPACVWMLTHLASIIWG